MTTPNIEELIAVLEATNQFHDNADICTADVIAALQTQAERIKELEADRETALAPLQIALDEVSRLRAQLAEIEKREPVAWAISYDGITPYTLWHEGNGPLLDYEVKRQGGTTQKMPLYTRPMPAQDVKDAERYQWLREYMISSATVYDDLIVAANSSVSFDRVIDTALANAKGAK